jgi:hypothetical protein
MQLLGRKLTQVRSGQPAQQSYRIDRNCPLDTTAARSFWHVGGTAGQDGDDLAGQRRADVLELVPEPLDLHAAVRPKQQPDRARGDEDLG